VFLRNCWYLAGWSDEVPEGGMIQRRIAGEFVLLLRDARGDVRALADSCPHRLVPLSRGTCAEGIVTCAYHGLRFDAAGRCVENPHGPISSALKVRSFGCAERHTAIWLWLGDAPADPARIPDFGFIDHTPPEARVTGYLHSQADYRLMIDNIMDLTHADYLHASSLGGGINTRARAKAELQGDAVIITWSASDDLLAPMHAQALGGDLTRGDFVNTVIWEAPGNMRQRVQLSRSGDMGTSAAMDSMTCHVMTPETATSTHYFFCHTSDGVTADPALGPMVRESLVAAFAGEDSPMLIAQTERIGGRDFWAQRPSLLPSDKGAVLARRALDRQLAQEEATVAHH
jgi:phenylpropionate dioxygenase-like ring-hydroxylating dioxygenase large terminal subunit